MIFRAVQVFSADDGTCLRAWGTRGSEPGQLQNPSGIVVSNAGEVFVAEFDTGNVRVFDAAGVFLRSFAVDANSQCKSGGLALSPNGDLLVCSQGKKAVLVFDASGELLRQFQMQRACAPWCCSVGPSGELFASCEPTGGSVWDVQVFR